MGSHPLTSDASPRLASAASEGPQATAAEEASDNPMMWSAARVGDWVVSLGYPEYRGNFVDNDIEGGHLLDFTKVSALASGGSQVSSLTVAVCGCVRTI
jgi:hypothetical protein